MKGVLPLIELEIASQLTAAGIVHVPVLPGQSDSPRPDEYVSIVAMEAEQRGSAQLCTVQIRVVGPTYSASADTLQERLDVVYRWATGSESPLNSYNENGLRIFGSSFPNFTSEIKESQRAEIMEIKVGAAAVS